MTNKKPLSKEELVHLAHLANLQLTPEELKKYGHQLEETLQYINNLTQLNTDKIPSTSQIGEFTNVFFPDGKKNDRLLTQEQALSQAHHVKNKSFVVKRIL